MLDPKLKECQALILALTREVAQHIQKVVLELGGCMDSLVTSGGPLPYPRFAIASGSLFAVAINLAQTTRLASRLHHPKQWNATFNMMLFNSMNACLVIPVKVGSWCVWHMETNVKLIPHDNDLWRESVMKNEVKSISYPDMCVFFWCFMFFFLGTCFNEKSQFSGYYESCVVFWPFFSTFFLCLERA